MQEQKNLGLVLGIVGVSIVLFAGLIFALVKLPSDHVSDGTPQDEGVTFADVVDPIIGPDRSAVTVHLYEDLQCPACAASHPAVEATIAKYKDRVRFIWKDFPLEQLHPFARQGADAARCAQDQSKFWEFEDLMYSKQDEWVAGDHKEDLFAGYARSIGMDEAKFRTCLTGNKGDSKVSDDQGEGMRNRVDRTPTFFINQKRYFSMSEADWSKALDQALAAVNTTSSTTGTK